MDLSSDTSIDDLVERYESLKVSAAWLGLEGDYEAEAALEAKLAKVWEELHQASN